VLKNHLDSDYTGKLYAVNPKAKKIMGVSCYPDVQSIGKKIDCAIVCVPARFVNQVVEDCGKAKVKSVVILSSGFSEAGEKGKQLEQELRKVIKKYKLKVIGPNCLGIANPYSGINTSFVSKMPLKGNVAFISQSGAMCSAILDWSFAKGFGFSAFLSIGNKAGLTEAELLRYLADDKNTKVILLYIEGIDNGRDFLAAASYANKKKPVLALKAGSTDAGAHAAMSHTGSLTGSDEVYDTALKQSGVMRVKNTRELFDIGLAMSELGLPKKDTVAIVTNSGGPGILASDAASSLGLELAKLTKSTVAKLKKEMPPQASTHNPVDVIGDADCERYTKALMTVAQDKNVGSLLALMCPQKMVDMSAIADSIIRCSRISKKPIVGCFMGGKSMEAGRERLKKAKIPHFENPEDGMMALWAISKYHHAHKHKKITTKTSVKRKLTSAQKIIKKAGKSLDEKTGLDLLNCYGISTIKSFVAKNVNETCRFAKKLGFPVAMKIASADILHKTDAGGVVLSLDNVDAVKKAYSEIMRNVKKKKPRAKILGVTVEKMAIGKEVIAGITRDPQFGPVLTFGLGGIYVEVLKDVTRRILPISINEAKKMILEIKSAPILTGVRGEKGVALDRLAETLVRLGQIAMDHPEISSIEINPLIATPRGCVAVDVLCILDKNNS